MASREIKGQALVALLDLKARKVRREIKAILARKERRAKLAQKVIQD